MGDRLRWFLLTPEGRRTLAAIYCVAAAISITVYWFWRGPWYALGQFLLLGFGLFWVRWCIRRPRKEGFQRG